MLPTLNGRLQTRIFMLVVFGGIITFLITPVMPDGGPGLPGFDGDYYRITYIILATVLVLGIVWELIYHVIQQFRWEKDWPTLFGLITAINEGALVWLLWDNGLIPGMPPGLRLGGPVSMPEVPSARSSSRPACVRSPAHAMRSQASRRAQSSRSCRGLWSLSPTDSITRRPSLPPRKTASSSRPGTRRTCAAWGTRRKKTGSSTVAARP